MAWAQTGPTQRPGGGNWSRAPGETAQDGLVAAACPLLAWCSWALASRWARPSGQGAGRRCGARPAVVHRGAGGPWPGCWWTRAISPFPPSAVHGAPSASRSSSFPPLPLLSLPTAPVDCATLRWSSSASPPLPPLLSHSKQRIEILLRHATSHGALLHLTLQTAAKRRSAPRLGRPWRARGRASVPALSHPLLAKCARAVRSRAWRTRRPGPWVLYHCS